MLERCDLYGICGMPCFRAFRRFCPKQTSCCRTDDHAGGSHRGTALQCRQPTNHSTLDRHCGAVYLWHECPHGALSRFRPQHAWPRSGRSRLFVVRAGGWIAGYFDRPHLGHRLDAQGSDAADRRHKRSERSCHLRVDLDDRFLSSGGSDGTNRSRDGRAHSDRLGIHPGTCPETHGRPHPRVIWHGRDDGSHYGN